MMPFSDWLSAIFREHRQYFGNHLKTYISGKALSFEKDDLKMLFEMKVDSDKLDFSDGSKWTLEKNGQFQNRKNGRLHNIRDSR